MAFTQHTVPMTTAQLLPRRLISPVLFIIPTEKEREYETRNLIRSIIVEDDDELTATVSNPVMNDNKKILFNVACFPLLVGMLAIGTVDILGIASNDTIFAFLFLFAYGVVVCLAFGGKPEFGPGGRDIDWSRYDDFDLDTGKYVGGGVVWSSSDGGSDSGSECGSDSGSDSGSDGD
jgi:hypothetical protein